MCWTPYVLTAKEESYGRIDPHLLQDLNGKVEIYRTGAWMNPGMLYFQVKSCVYRLAGKQQVFRKKVASYHPVKGDRRENWLGRVRRVARSLCNSGGGELTWTLPALFKAMALMRIHQFDYVYTTGPPHDVHLVGLVLKKIYGVKWVADFRDPWSSVIGQPGAVQARRSKVLENVIAFLEKQVVKNADNVLVTTGRLADAFANLYPKGRTEKFHNVFSGFDPDDFISIQVARPTSKFRVAYLGTFYVGRTPELFLEAVRALIDDNKILEDRLDIRFIGACRYAEGKSVEEMVKQAGLSSVVTIEDAVPHTRALEEMGSAHVLLLFAPDQPLQIPGKIFEYLASGSDILAFTSEGATADLLRQVGRGTVVKPDALEEIKGALEASYVRFCSPPCPQKDHPQDDPMLVPYHKQTLTAKLVELLEQRSSL